MQEQQTPDGNDFRRAVNLTFLVANTHAVCLTPFIRHSFGMNMPGFPGLLAFILMFAAAGLMGDLRMLVYLAAWVCMVLVHRIWSFLQRRAGWIVHSYYDGWPWLAMRLPFSTTEFQARNSEPVLCIPLGFLLAVWSPAVGVFVLGGVLSLAIVNGMQAEIRKRRVTAMRDLQIEQRALSERLRGVRHDF